MPYTPATRRLTVTRPHPDDVGDDPYGLVSSVAYHHSFTKPKLRRKKNDPTRESLLAEADERLDAAREESRAASGRQVEEFRAGATASPAPPPKKRSGSKKQKGALTEVARKRGPTRKTKERWAAEDAAAGVGNYEELSPALERDDLPMLPYEMDDVIKDIQGALK